MARSSLITDVQSDASAPDDEIRSDLAGLRSVPPVRLATLDLLVNAGRSLELVLGVALVAAPVLEQRAGDRIELGLQRSLGAELGVLQHRPPGSASSLTSDPRWPTRTGRWAPTSSPSAHVSTSPAQTMKNSGELARTTRAGRIDQTRRDGPRSGSAGCLERASQIRARDSRWCDATAAGASRLRPCSRFEQQASRV